MAGVTSNAAPLGDSIRRLRRDLCKPAL